MVYRVAGSGWVLQRSSRRFLPVGWSPVGAPLGGFAGALRLRVAAVGEPASPGLVRSFFAVCEQLCGGVAFSLAVRRAVAVRFGCSLAPSRLPPVSAFPASLVRVALSGALRALRAQRAGLPLRPLA